MGGKEGHIQRCDHAIMCAPLADLRGEIVRGPDDRVRILERVLEDAGNTKVAEPQAVVRCQENVLELQIPVQYLPLVHVVHCRAELDQPAQDLRLRKGMTPPLGQTIAEIASSCENRETGASFVSGL